jgi:glycosyltransferase involved in cell wall biosynthesis
MNLNEGCIQPVKRKALISVVTAVYNTKKYLDKAISSVLTQTFQDFEYVIVDDGSTDGSYEMLQEYADKNLEKIRLYRQENQGAFFAYNRCTELAEGQYIMTLNSDDYLAEDCLEIAASYVNKYGVDVVLINTTTHIADMDQNIIEHDNTSSEMTEEMVLLDKSSVRSHWPLFIRLGLVRNNINLYKASLMKKHPYRTDWYGADYLLNINIADEIESIACSPKNLYHNFEYVGNKQAERNISVGKYYPYEHDMFNTFFIEYKRLFASWNILSPESMRYVAGFRLNRLNAEIMNINAWNNSMSWGEKVTRLVYYFDDVIAEASAIRDCRKPVEEAIISSINRIHLEAVKQLASNKENKPEHYILRLIEAVVNDGYPRDLRAKTIRETLINESNPYSLGLSYYESFCNNNPTEEDLTFLEYIKTKELARAYVLSGNYKLAVEEIIKLFNSQILEPEKFLLLGLNCFYIGLTDDAADAVAMGLEMFPGYHRLVDTKEMIKHPFSR